MPKYLDPKADLTFKKIFGQHPNLVMSLLNALLPLPENRKITSVEYLTPENIPENPGKKYSIVDVFCTDNTGRQFIVEMQSYWNTEFFPRTLFNVTSVYARQLDKGMAFGDLRDVYALCLVNDEKAFNYEGEYIQEYYLMNRNHPEDDIHTDISLIFIQLPKFKPQNRAEKFMQDLWLKFLTEIDENTIDVAPDIVSNKDTAEALEILKYSVYSKAEVLAYQTYWLNVSTEKSAMQREHAEGHAEGLAEGLEKGREEGLKEGHQKGREEGLAEGHQKGLEEGLVEGIEKGEKNMAIYIAKRMKAKGDDIDKIMDVTGLSYKEIENA